MGVIGNLSRITPWKGQLEILLPFIQYSKQNPNAYFELKPHQIEGIS